MLSFSPVSSTPSLLHALAWWSTSHPQAPTALGQTSVIPRVILKLKGHSVSRRKQRSTSCLHSDRNTGASFPGHSAGSQNSSSCKFHEKRVPHKLPSRPQDRSVRVPTADTNFPLPYPVTSVINGLVEISFPVLKYGMTENAASGFTAPHGTQI